RLAEIYRIPKIEELAAELDLPQPLRNREALHDRQVRRRRSRTAKHIPAEVAEAAGRIGGEGSGVEERIDEIVAAGVVAVRKAAQIGATPTHVGRGVIASGGDVKGRAANHRYAAEEIPASQCFAEQSSPARDLVIERAIEDMGTIFVRARPVGAHVERILR